jgi:acyl carrier protein
MRVTYAQVLADLLDLMGQLAGDWEYSDAITTETRLFADMGYESLDLVILGTTLEEHYGRMPFSEFLAQLGQREIEDVTVGQLVEFVCEHASVPAITEAR